jgi:energy-coupling factor transport system permease protein
MRPHPLIRILCFVVFAALLPQLPARALALVFMLLAAAAAVSGTARRLWRGIAAMKWLIAALMLVSLAFTPGDPLTSWLPGFSREGAEYGVFRALLLFDLVAAVAVLIGSVPPSELAAALVMLLYPLRELRIPVERIAIRIGLTLASLETLLSGVRNTGVRGQPVRVLADWCRQIETAAAEPGTADFDPPTLPAPPLPQWSLPVILAGVMLVLRT